MIDKRNEFPINSYERKANGNVEFTFVVSNKTGSGASVIANSYKISEMGIYAQDDSGTEILYAYNKGTDGDYIPVYNGKNAIDIIEKCIIVIDQAATLNVTIDNSMTYLTRESADRRYLEIQALAKIIGLEFGGNIQDTGNKVKGKFYFDSVTKFYYECIENTNLTYNESSKFRAISNKPLSDRVENLSKVQQAKLYVHSEATGQGRTTCNIVQKCGNIVTIIFDSGDTLRYTNDNTVIFSIPEGYRPKSFLSVNASQFNGTAGTIYIQTDGTAKWKGPTVTTASIIFSVSYII